MSTTTNLGLFKHDNPATNTNAFDVKGSLNDNWDKIDENAGDVSQTLQQQATTISNINTTLTNNLNTEITNRQTAVADLQTQINSVASGSPAGVYSTVSALTTADPDHSKIYVVSADGHWYYYGNSQWNDGGVYQATEDSETINQLQEDVSKIKRQLDIVDNVIFKKDEITGTINSASVNYKWETFDCITQSGEDYYINYNGQNATNFALVQLIDDNGAACSAVINTREGLPHIIRATGNGTKIRFSIYPNYPNGTIGDSATFTDVVLTKYVDYVLTEKVFEVGTGYRYSMLKKALEDATKFVGSKVIVHGGIYNLYNEFGGATFFDNYTSSSSVGLILKNDVHVKFENNAKVTFMYDGSNPTVVSRFSPFNIEQANGSKGFTLENVNIECTNCRYCVHDEKGGNTDSYVTKYINCNMSIEYLIDETFKYAHLCIGCGLGHEADMNVQGCILNTGILIHNNASLSDTTAKSKVVIKDNYCKYGYIRLQHCGASELKTQMLVSNNSIASNIIVEQSQSVYIRDNIEVYQWNNNIHN